MSLLGFLLFVASASAAGPFDGQWQGTTGRGFYTDERVCFTGDVHVTVAAGRLQGKVIGSAYDFGTLSLAGEVAPDGTVTGTTNFAEKFAGTFTGDKFAGTLQSKSCGTLSVTLERRN